MCTKQPLYVLKDNRFFFLTNLWIITNFSHYWSISILLFVTKQNKKDIWIGKQLFHRDHTLHYLVILILSHRWQHLEITSSLSASTTDKVTLKLSAVCIYSYIICRYISSDHLSPSSSSPHVANLCVLLHENKRKFVNLKSSIEDFTTWCQWVLNEWMTLFHYNKFRSLGYLLEKR